jgi:hypothetical protein
MYPHERSLVKRLQDQPFVLLGVNTDDSREELQNAVKAEGLTWRSWWDGGMGGPISRKYRVDAYPTLFLIDHKGAQRQKWVGAPSPEVLDKAINKLLAEAAKDTPP